MDTITDDRGVEYIEALFVDLSTLPKGWAQCGGCGRSWNDDKSTAWTPTPSARCPFEYDHTDPAEDITVAASSIGEGGGVSIPLDDRSKLWYQGVAAGIDVSKRLYDDWRGQPIEYHRNVFWFLVGVEAAERVTSTGDAELFMAGAAVRQPQDDSDDDEEGDDDD